MSLVDEAVARYMAGLANLKWDGLTPAQKAEHVRLMVRGRAKARRLRKASESKAKRA